MNRNNHCEILKIINKGMDLCHLNGPQAYRLLKKLTGQSRIKKTGERKHAVYTRNA